MNAWHEVGSLADVEREGRLLIRIGGREIGVVRNPDGGGLHALRNRCPHSGAPLCLGSVRKRETGEPGRYAVEDRAVLHCPWHGWEFDIDSGRCVDDERMRVAVYPVRVEAGRVFVQA